MPGSAVKPATVFREKGFRVGWRRTTAPSPQFRALSPGARLRSALEELGGIYGAYGEFLSWRADLLSLDYISALAALHPHAPERERSAFTHALIADLQLKGERLASDMEDAPCWNTPWRLAYRSRWEGRAVVVQLAQDPFAEGEWKQFEKAVALLDHPDARRATSPALLAEFREWARLSEDPARERAYIVALARQPGGTLLEPPRLIEELCAGRVLAWEWVDGVPLSTVLARKSIEAVARLAECLLEQLCVLGVVNAEIDPDAYVVKADGNIALRRATRLRAVPAPLASMVLRYVTAVLANDQPAANELLLRLAGDGVPVSDGASLFDALSALQPELKVRMRFPDSGKRFEANWRAISQLTPRLPAFLSDMNRNLIALSYWNARALEGQTLNVDCISEGYWKVLGRLLNNRIRGLFSRDSVAEWVVGSGLLFFEGVRQAGRLADGVRDKDVALGVELTGDSEPGRRPGEMAELTRSLVIAGMLALVFVLSLRLAAASSGPLSWALLGVGVLSGFAAFVTVLGQGPSDGQR